MPAASTLSVTITIRPLEGISEVEVGKFGRWVGELKGVERAAAVLEYPGTPKQHLHCGIQFKEKVTGDNVKRKIWTLFANELKNEERWAFRDRAIHCTAHTDFMTLVGGYFRKDNHIVCFMTNVSEDELAIGAASYAKCLAKKEEKVCSRGGLMAALVATYRRKLDEALFTKDPDERNSIIEQVEKLTPEHCLKILIAEGKGGYLIHWPQQRKTINQFWQELKQAPKL